MWKFTAKYEDYNGKPKEKELRFNISDTELRKLQFSIPGGLDKYYANLAEEKDPAKIYEAFDKFVDMSYGVVSDDGEEFVKSPEILAKFKSSPAYDAFMDYIMTSENGASKFIMGVFSKKVMNILNSPEGKKIAEENGIDITPIINK